jgi:hypothetical protein
MDEQRECTMVEYTVSMDEQRERLNCGMGWVGNGNPPGSFPGFRATELTVSPFGEVLRKKMPEKRQQATSKQERNDPQRSTNDGRLLLLFHHCE